MKKIFTFFISFVSSVGTMFASNTQVDGIWYDFDSSTQTASVTYKGSSYKTDYNEYIDTVVIPSSVTYNNVIYDVVSVGEQAFASCRGLKSVIIPNSVTNIESAAFCDCTGLTSVTIPNSVTSIGELAFYRCSGLTSVFIGNSVEYIDYGAFEGCTGLTSVTIPNSVKTVGGSAFYDCTGLTSVHVNDIGAWCAISFGEFQSNPLGYAHNLYLNDELITNLTIPDGFTKIGDFAFEGGACLTSVTIPNSVTSIGEWAFADCSGLSSLTIPNSVISIREFAFVGCLGLNSPLYNAHVFAYLPPSYFGAYEIPDGIESIAGGAFGADSLTSVTIPNSVTNIEGWAFYECKGLSSIINYAKTPQQIYEAALGDVNRLTCKLYVPEESIALYQKANTWKDFYNILPIGAEEGIEEVVENHQQDGKLLIDGTIYILRGEKVYNAQGQEVR